jgi:hypothetical protein
MRVDPLKVQICAARACPYEIESSENNFIC